MKSAKVILVSPVLYGGVFLSVDWMWKEVLLEIFWIRIILRHFMPRIKESQTRGKK
jgi:hypothetical protein